MQNKEITTLLNIAGSDVIKPGLERTLQALEVMGNPHLKLPETIHFAGTNGKGSTLAVTRAILESSGLRCHSYTSPHLVEFNERIVLAGECISDDYLRELILEVNNRCAHIGLTFFEATTVVTFLAFAATEADYLLLETGMGGRFDSTNVVPNPIAMIITPISFDHTEFLGDNITSISLEKAGIIKPSGICISAKQVHDAEAVITDSALRIGVDLYVYGKNWHYEITASGFDLHLNNKVYSLPHPALQGGHQYMNAAVAAATILLLNIKKVELENVRAGIRHAIWAGRLHKLKAGELVDIAADKAEIIVDGAHNPAGAQALRDYLAESDSNILITGMLKTKDAEDFFRILKPILSKVYLVDIKGAANAYSKEYLQEVCMRLNLLSETVDSVESAVRLCVCSDICNDANNKIIIAGSLYLAGMVLSSNS